MLQSMLYCRDNIWIYSRDNRIYRVLDGMYVCRVSYYHGHVHGIPGQYQALQSMILYRAIRTNPTSYPFSPSSTYCLSLSSSILFSISPLFYLLYSTLSILILSPAPLPHQPLVFSLFSFRFFNSLLFLTLAFLSFFLSFHNSLFLSFFILTVISVPVPAQSFDLPLGP